MSDTDKRIMCIVEGNQEDPFPITITTQVKYIGDLKNVIYREINKGPFRDVNAKDLALWEPKETIPLLPVKDRTSLIETLRLDFEKFATRLDGGEKVADKFKNQDEDFLSVIIRLPTSGGQQGPMKETPPENKFMEYKEIFVKLRERGKFNQDDIKNNDIRLHEESNMSAPDFVEEFNGKLDRKPTLDPLDIAWHDIVSGSPHFQSYFELPRNDWTPGQGSYGSTRRATLSEVIHTVFLEVCSWEQLWQSKESKKNPLKERGMDVIFAPLVGTVGNSMAKALQNKRWPFHVIVICEDDQVLNVLNDPQQSIQLRTYCPRSDFLILNFAGPTGTRTGACSGTGTPAETRSGTGTPTLTLTRSQLSPYLPRLLVEVNSTSSSTSLYPPDLIRMLLMGAFVVRFANQFVQGYKEHKNFVLCAMFLWDKGGVTRYTLYQQEEEQHNCQRQQVHVKSENFSLNHGFNRVKFARILYNLLCVDIDQDRKQAMANEIQKFQQEVLLQNLPPLYTKSWPEGTSSPDNDGSDGGAGGGGGGNNKHLTDKGYAIKSDAIVDAKGIKWDFKMPVHILTVYKPKYPGQEYIAKKLRGKSEELKILARLERMELKSKNVIPLLESFSGWIILPKLIPLRGVKQARESEVVDVCKGLIAGVTYLHRNNITHRDIKPDNLVVDRDFCLRIIDFDLAMEVKDENELVDDRRGTEHWMAPEVDNNLMHSPIKADRWACGRVLLYLLGRFDTRHEDLEHFARALCTKCPDNRPPLLG